MLFTKFFTHLISLAACSALVRQVSSGQVDLAGQSWQRLNNNLPTVAVHDLVIHPRDNDLVAATHGRSLWILDDITPLQQLSDQVITAENHVFDVRPAVADASVYVLPSFYREGKPRSTQEALAMAKPRSPTSGSLLNRSWVRGSNSGNGSSAGTSSSSLRCPGGWKSGWKNRRPPDDTILRELTW